MFDVVILTDERFVNPKKQSEYIDNVITEDRMVMEALDSHGLKTKKVAWSDTSFNWSQTRVALFRTTWDYAEKFTAFSDWLMEVSMKTKLVNNYETIIWNLDKHYLEDLQMAGVNIVETHFIEPGDKRSLQDIHSELGWERTVLKPAISAAAKDTFKLNPDDRGKFEKRYRELIKDEAMMLQPFQDDVVARGEISLMLIGGEYTHAVLKVAKPGDFRVQDDFGGTVEDYSPSPEEIDLAIAAVNACENMPLYARVDIVNDNNGNPAVSELELVEPEMWFRKNEESAELLAEAIKKLF
ncbi:ATP-grasp domain-containing protein [Ekhidna sp. To15]|uniref:ATP-grasp domain-containing protein n=1 Tax=Ekhidna sp. To15 TaxID=3395267 RepID=UPI003F51D61C